MNLETITIDPTPPARAFAVHDLETLTWYVRKLSSITTEQGRVRHQAERITNDLEREAEGLRFQFGVQAGQTVRRLIAERGGRAQHIKTLFGDAGLRRTPSLLTITNSERAREWLETNAPDCLEVKINSRAVTQKFTVSNGVIATEDGEIVSIPGVTILEGLETFYVKAKTLEEKE